MGGPEVLLYPGSPHRVLLGFNPPFSLILLNLEGNWGMTRKGIRFWIERLIINLARELILGGLGFNRRIVNPKSLHFHSQ